MTDLLDRWPVPDREPAAGLLSAWSDPGRGYHGVRHLEEVLDRIDELLADDPLTGEQAAIVRLAAWFHDAVYEGSPDDEERSAELAENLLPATGLAADTVHEVARLVRLTVAHDPSADDRLGAILCDADLAILAAGPRRYREYVRDVRRDYAHIPDESFNMGRRVVLERLLNRPVLFHTALGRRLWEPAARRNLAGELAALSGSGAG